MPGWLGAGSPESFLDCMQRDEPLPCHQTIDYDDLAPAGRSVPIDEVRALLRTASSQDPPWGWRDQALFITIFAGGLRRQEVSALNTAQYDPATGKIQIRPQRRSWSA